MLSVFDVDKLRDLLRDFYALSHIRITVFDENLNELVAYPEKVAPYCSVIRGTSRGFDACMACDRAACEKAFRKHGTYLYRCHAGLTEAVTPLYVGDVLVGYLFFGHVFSYTDHEEGWAAIKRCCEELPVNKRMLREAVLQAQPIDEATVRSAAHILHAVASYLIMERMASLREDELAVRLDAYLSAHFTDEINAPHICEVMGIGKTQLYKISKQLYGCGIAEHVRDLRMNLARQLLLEKQELSLAEIAGRCGYDDYNYFISVFSRCNNCSPGAYRKSKRE